MTEDNELISAAVLAVKPGDALVLRVRGVLSAQAVKRLGEDLRDRFPRLKELGVPTLVLEEEATLKAGPAALSGRGTLLLDGVEISLDLIRAAFLAPGVCRHVITHPDGSTSLATSTYQPGDSTTAFTSIYTPPDETAELRRLIEALAEKL